MAFSLNLRYTFTMYSAKLDTDHFLLRLEHGEEIIDVLKNFCTQQHITNASVNGIGSLENPTLAHYRLDTKKYTEQTKEGLFELINLSGNIGLFEDNPMVHTHATISNEAMQVFGGHLVKGIVSATAEIILTTFPTAFQKKHDEAIGLKLWQLE